MFIVNFRINNNIKNNDPLSSEMLLAQKANGIALDIYEVQEDINGEKGLAHLAPEKFDEESLSDLYEIREALLKQEREMIALGAKWIEPKREKHLGRSKRRPW